MLRSGFQTDEAWRNYILHTRFDNKCLVYVYIFQASEIAVNPYNLSPEEIIHLTQTLKDDPTLILL